MRAGRSMNSKPIAGRWLGPTGGRRAGRKLTSIDDRSPVRASLAASAWLAANRSAILSESSPACGGRQRFALGASPDTTDPGRR
jgi:hypothetical protein